MTVTRMRHDTPEKQAVAAANTVLRVQVGSRLHGVAVNDYADRDEFGIVVEPPEYVVGVKEFDQYEHRPAGLGNPSQPGDIDYIAFSLRKWVQMAAAGNVTAVVPLFAPDDKIIHIDWPGAEIMRRPGLFLSKLVGAQFLRYVESHRKRVLHKTMQCTPSWYDTKAALHALLAGYHGAELLRTGRMTLPTPEPLAGVLKDIRRGETSKHCVLDSIERYERDIAALTDTTRLPDTPDYDKLSAWLYETYRCWWYRERRRL